MKPVVLLSTPNPIQFEYAPMSTMQALCSLAVCLKGCVHLSSMNNMISDLNQNLLVASRMADMLGEGALREEIMHAHARLFTGDSFDPVDARNLCVGLDNMFSELLRNNNTRYIPTVE